MGLKPALNQYKGHLLVPLFSGGHKPFCKVKSTGAMSTVLCWSLRLKKFVPVTNITRTRKHSGVLILVYVVEATPTQINKLNKLRFIQYGVVSTTYPLKEYVLKTIIEKRGI